MFTYLARFLGRHKGAIGIMHQCRVTVVAKDPVEARLQLYESYEHIHGLALTITHIDGKPVDQCT
jgi:hypothetical protein